MPILACALRGLAMAWEFYLRPPRRRRPPNSTPGLSSAAAGPRDGCALSMNIYTCFSIAYPLKGVGAEPPSQRCRNKAFALLRQFSPHSPDETSFCFDLWRFSYNNQQVMFDLKERPWRTRRVNWCADN